MDVVYSHCCGLDVHKNSAVARAITPRDKDIKPLQIMTDDLIAISA